MSGKRGLLRQHAVDQTFDEVNLNEGDDENDHTKEPPEPDLDNCKFADEAGLNLHHPKLGPFRHKLSSMASPHFNLEQISSSTDTSLHGSTRYQARLNLGVGSRCASNEPQVFGHTSTTTTMATPVVADLLAGTSRPFMKSASLEHSNETTRTPSLVEELLNEIYARCPDVSGTSRRTSYYDSSTTNTSRRSGSPESDCMTEYSTTSEPSWQRSSHRDMGSTWTQTNVTRKETQWKKLQERGLGELRHDVHCLETHIHYAMSQLTRQVKRRDRLRQRRQRQYNLITAILQAASQKRSQDTRIRFSLEPSPGDHGFEQWKDAMKMVARLPEGFPKEFRKRLWLNLADKYLETRRVDWNKACRFCFNEWTNPDDDNLGLQIVRDLHRTGCSLFSGNEAEENQLMLKRVLLAYARWNKAIGYCQGFNMLAAIILEVMDKSETDALKVMILMIEGVLPDCYFTNNLRGLSIDMAVFRDLLKLKLPTLSKHLDALQQEAKEGGSAYSYEPPLTNVFTMQWFLTLFSTCLPGSTVLRVWDLILLEGNEVLLRTALAIWKGLENRILTVATADEFYCSMGLLTREMLDFTNEESDRLIWDLVQISPFPFVEIEELREKHTYNITPWSQGLAVAKKGLRILYSDDEDNLEDDDEQIAVAATFGISAVFKNPRSPAKQTLQCKVGSSSSLASWQNKDRLSVDISALRKQYTKLRQRQKQAQIILTTALTRHQPPAEDVDGKSLISGPGSIAMNHLLLGKKPLLMSRPRRGPPPGAIPAPKQKSKISGRPGDTNANPTKYSCPQPEMITPTSGSESTARQQRQGQLKSPLLEETEGSGLHDLVDDSPATIQHNQSSSSSSKRGKSCLLSTDHDVQTGTPHYVPINNKSSSTELCCASGDDETENATDIEDIPKDKESAPFTMEVDDDHGFLLQVTKTEREKEIFVDFDENSAIIERQLPHSANSQRAVQIIKENSEILEKIMRKKSDQCGTLGSTTLSVDEAHQPAAALGRETSSRSIMEPNPLLADEEIRKLAGLNIEKGNVEEHNGQGRRKTDSWTRRSNSHGDGGRSKQIKSDEAGVSRHLSSCSDGGFLSVRPGEVDLDRSLRKLSYGCAYGESTKPITFNPFPKPVLRKRNEVGKKLGLY